MTRRSLPAPTLHTARLRLRPFHDADSWVYGLIRREWRPSAGLDPAR